MQISSKMKTPKIDNFKDFLLDLIHCAVTVDMSVAVDIDVGFLVAAFAIIASNCRKIVRIVEKCFVAVIVKRGVLFRFCTFGGSN